MTLVERTTRYTLLGHLPDGRHDSATVGCVVIRLFAALPVTLRRTLTWDQGKEMARHRDIASAVDDLAEIQEQLNERPRGSLAWTSPGECFANLLSPPTVLRP